MTTDPKCERHISGVPGHATCPNKAIVKVILTKIVTFADTDEEVEYLCPTHFNVYLTEIDAGAQELVSEGWAVMLR